MMDRRVKNGNKMKAVIIDAGTIRVKDIPKPKPSANEALIKVCKAGICNTDLEIAKGYMQFEGTLGHEFVGEVEYAADQSWIGKKVVGEINIYCGLCDYCRLGMTKHCSQRDVLGILSKEGAFAEYLTLPLQNCHPVPASLSDSEAVFAEPVAAALEIFERVNIGKEAKTLILGDGKLGLLVAHIMRQHTVNVTCVGKHSRNLDTLKRVGIETHLSGIDLDRQFSVIVEATGNEKGLEEALRLVCPRGIIVLKSTYRGKAQIDVSQIVVDEVQLLGSRCGPFPKAIRQIEQRMINVIDLIDGDFPLERSDEAFALAREPGTLKILLTP
ncbi:alcohol dehydrogenase catalytic domain-containing protein [Acidobacteriota bacterium]